jgi:hypothetical protein
VFFRFLFLLSLIFAAIYGYLLINHFIITKDFSKPCLYSFLPCFLLYNSFTKQESLTYTITLICFLGIGIGTCLYQLVTQDKVRRIQAYVLQDGSKKFSKMFFSSPDWSLVKRDQTKDVKISITIALENMIREEEVQTKIKNRTRGKKIELYAVRVISMLINAAIVGASWVAIFYVNVYQNDISTYMSKRY